MIGPGAIARPVFSADQPQTSCSHSTSDSSIAPNAVENSSATRGAGERPHREQRAVDQRIALAGAVRRRTGRAAPPRAASTPIVRGRRPSPRCSPLTSPKRERADPGGDQHRAQRVGRGHRVAGHLGQPAPADDQRGHADRDVDEEHPPPARGDQQAADDRAERGGEAADRRPGPDRAVRGARPGRRPGAGPSEVGVSSAAPAAWTTRKATSIGRLVAAAQAAEAAMNTATPSRKPRSRR